MHTQEVNSGDRRPREEGAAVMEDHKKPAPKKPRANPFATSNSRSAVGVKEAVGTTNGKGSAPKDGQTKNLQGKARKKQTQKDENSKTVGVEGPRQAPPGEEKQRPTLNPLASGEIVIPQPFKRPEQDPITILQSSGDANMMKMQEKAAFPPTVDDDSETQTSELSTALVDKEGKLTPLWWYWKEAIFASRGPFCLESATGLVQLIEKYCDVNSKQEVDRVKDRLGKLRKALIDHCFDVLEARLKDPSMIADIYAMDPFLVLGDEAYFNLTLEMSSNSPVPRVIELALRHADNKPLEKMMTMFSLKSWYR